MDLSHDALERSVALLRAISAPGSLLALDYIPRREADETPQGARRGAAQLLRAGAGWLRAAPLLLWLRLYAGEPLRLAGWRHSELPAWMAARGWRVRSDVSAAELAASLDAPAATVAAIAHDGMGGIHERYVSAVRVSASRRFTL